MAANETNVVTPVIDVIDDNTLHYQYSGAKSTSIGGFDWNLQFNWHSMPQRERSRRRSDIDPVRYVLKIVIVYNFSGNSMNIELLLNTLYL